MAKNDLRFSDVLEQRLIAAATKSRPAFSNDLQRRIMAAVDEESRAIIPAHRWDFLGWRSSLLAASLAFAIASGWMIGRWTSEPQGNQIMVANVAEEDDAESVQWTSLDDNMLAAADWLVDEVPIDLMLTDSDESSSR
jgi:hypothetical protein